MNPPLVRLVATAPLSLLKTELDCGNAVDSTTVRPEWLLYHDFVRANSTRVLSLHKWARWSCIPFALLGGYVCFRWASELYGTCAGGLALTLWCFSPNVLAHGQLITPDVGATALGIAAAYSFWHWLKEPMRENAALAGLLLGLAELARTTWIVLFLLWPVLWIVWRCPFQGERPSLRKTWRREAAQLASLLLWALFLINLGYGFEGSFQRLADYRFVSHTLGGGPNATAEHGTSPGSNRFAGTYLGGLPVPLPRSYVMGIDRQQGDFERGLWSYLRGEWRLHGWWYYYLYALAIKEPLGTWLLLLVTIGIALFARRYGSSWRDESMLLLPMLVAAAALSWSVSSSLWAYPHSLSYFNELVGGPANGHFHLLHSNTDWGQDLFYLKAWLEKHPEARLVGLEYDMPLLDPKLAGIDYLGSIPEDGPRPGWYAVSVNAIHDRLGRFEYFLRLQPVGTAGYSIYVYHVTLDEARRVRTELGLPPLPVSVDAAR